MIFVAPILINAQLFCYYTFFVSVTVRKIIEFRTYGRTYRHTDRHSLWIIEDLSILKTYQKSPSNPKFLKKPPNEKMPFRKTLNFLFYFPFGLPLTHGWQTTNYVFFAVSLNLKRQTSIKIYTVKPVDGNRKVNMTTELTEIFLCVALLLITPF